jgi:hypothetical protein
MEPDRVRTIAEWPEPASHRNIEVFLGFANFYRRFINSFSWLAKPMIDMLKGRRNGCFLGPFLPTPAMKRSFAELQDVFMKVPVLAHFDLARPICLEMDALGFAIAGIILQQRDEVRSSAEGTARGAKGRTNKGQWHPVAYWSRSMSPAEQNYAVGNQEMLAIIISCRYWHHYLEGARHPVEVLTNHHNLQRFMITKLLTGRQVRWWETLSGYNLNIVYRAGKKNPADAPSRRPDYAKVPEGRCTATILIVRCSATFSFRQLYAAAVQEDKVFKDVPPDTLTDLIQQGQVEDHTAKEVCTALGFPRGYPAKEHSVPATLLCQYKSHWQQHNGLLYY